MWLKEIKDEVIKFTHKTAKDILDHLKIKFLSLTNTKNKDQLKVTDFPWNLEEDIAMHFTKLHKG